ncbi:MAG: methyltransferase domain-containing protein [Candidatus Zixiibacteriota bacterium]|nr:MAG: methyltransferase domain-containing protein [candidate division Zixibacteria bacterium]
MGDIWSRPAGASTNNALDYWEYFGQRLVELADIGQGADVLDVGAGQGSSFFPEAKKVGPGGKVVGIELCRHCMGITFGKIKNQKLDNAWILNMDAGYMGFGNDTFDFALCGFVGWYYCFDFTAGRFTDEDIRAREIARVLKKGGKVGISSWARQDDIEWLDGMIRRYLNMDEPAEGELPGNDQLVYSKESKEGLEKILSAAGFRGIEILEETETFFSKNKETWWEQMRRVGWHDHFEKIKSKDKGSFEKLKVEVFEGLEHFREEDGIRFSKSVLFAFGTK